MKIETISKERMVTNIDDVRRSRQEKLRLRKAKMELEQDDGDLSSRQKSNYQDCLQMKIGDNWTRDNQNPIEKVNEIQEDPLDVYMSSIEEECQQFRQPMIGLRLEGPSHPRSNNFILISGHAKGISSSAKSGTNKGEIMEQNQDGLEYSDEETTYDVKDSRNSKEQKLPDVDYSEICCIPFRKNLYNQPAELAKLTDDEVQKIRQELDGITVKGGNVVPPVQRWSQLGLTAKMISLLRRKGYESPTPIQSQAIPVILSGRDMIAISKTGSGKTLAFLLPLIRHVNSQQPLRSGDGPIAIVMAPTRELCIQIGNQLRTLTKASRNIGFACLYGGASMPDQIRTLKKGVEIVICTPGRMFGMLAMSKGKVTNLRRLSLLVLDEADRMFDNGLEPTITKIINHARPERQIVMFSATFPRRVEAIGRKNLDNFVEVMVGDKSKICKDVQQNVHILVEQEKFMKLLDLMENYSEHSTVLIFVNRQEKADDLLKELMVSGYKASASIHGGIDQDDRDSIMKRFKSGSIRYLITTSLGARGLDVKNLNLVVNYDCPNHYEDYVHRCGRTGRAGQKGHAHTFLKTDEGSLAGFLLKALADGDGTISPDLVALWNNTKSKIKSEGKSISYLGKGYGGSGYKFDYTDEKSLKQKKSLQKRITGLEESDSDENDDKEDNLNEGTHMVQKESKYQNNVKDYLINNDFKMRKRRAQLVAEKLNKKLSYDGNTVQSYSKRVDEELRICRFEEKIVINDYPQPIRKLITARKTLSQISDFSEVAITIRGNYFPRGSVVPDDKDKLFILIESSVHTEVQKASHEINRQIKERLSQLQLCSRFQIMRCGY